MRRLEFLIAIASALLILAIFVAKYAWMETETSYGTDSATTETSIALRGGTSPVRITSDDAMYVTVDSQILGMTTPVTVLLTEKSMHKISLSAVNSNAVHELYIWPDPQFVQNVHLRR